MENKWTVVMMGQFSQYLLVCLLKVMDNVVRKSSTRQNNEIMRLLAIIAMREVRGDLVD